MATKNKIEDLRNHIFASLERLDDDSLTQEQLQAEIARAHAVSSLASVLVNSAKIEVQYMATAMRIKDKDIEINTTNFIEQKNIERG